MKKIVEFDGFLIKPEAVDFVGNADFARNSGEGSYGFEAVVNGSKIRIGSTRTKDEADELCKTFKDMVLKINEQGE